MVDLCFFLYIDVVRVDLVSCLPEIGVSRNSARNQAGSCPSSPFLPHLWIPFASLPTEANPLRFPFSPSPSYGTTLHSRNGTFSPFFVQASVRHYRTISRAKGLHQLKLPYEYPHNLPTAPNWWLLLRLPRRRSVLINIFAHKTAKEKSNEYRIRDNVVDAANFYTLLGDFSI